MCKTGEVKVFKDTTSRRYRLRVYDAVKYGKLMEWRSIGVMGHYDCGIRIAEFMSPSLCFNVGILGTLDHFRHLCLTSCPLTAYFIPHPVYSNVIENYANKGSNNA